MLKLVPTKLIRRIAPEVLSRTAELKKLSDWRQKLIERRKKLAHLRLNVQQMEGDLVVEERDWEVEADRLANDIVVIDHGRAIAHGTADELKAQVGGERIELVLGADGDLDKATTILGLLAEGPVTADAHTRRITAPVSGGSPVLIEALRRLDADAITVMDVALRRPTLDDVFLTLTGHAAEDDAAAGAGKTAGRTGRKAKEGQK